MTTGLGKCYNCGFHFIISTKVKALSRHQPVRKENWKLPRTDHLKPLDAVAIDYLMKRGIRPETAKKAGVCSAHRVIGGTERHCLAFTFREGTKVVNIQYKTTDKLFAMEPDCEIIPWRRHGAAHVQPLPLLPLRQSEDHLSGRRHGRGGRTAAGEAGGVFR